MRIESWVPAWKFKLAGYGQSSPVAAGDLIFVTSVSGAMKEQLHIEAINQQSGKRVWRHDAKNSSPAKSSNYISRAAPSPVCDDDGVIAQFEGGNIIALDRRGKVRWQRDLVADYGAIKARHGLGSSPAQDDTQVFVWVERQDKPYVAALSKKTGEVFWKSPGLDVTSWSSPRLIEVGDKRQLLLSGIGKIAGVDAASGDHLWSFDDISGNSTPTPMPIGNGRFLIGATEGRGESGGGNAAASNGVIEIVQADDGKFEAKYVWRAAKATSSFGSPVAYQGHAYFVNRSGVVYCLDLQTGKQQYAKRTQGSVWATPLATRDRLYLFGTNGTTTIVKSGATFKTLAENQLWSTESQAAGGPGSGATLYAAAAAGSQLILRRGDVLYCVGK